MQKPDAIILTMPERFFTQYPGGEKNFLRVMAQVDHGVTMWHNTIATIPRHEVLWCYLLYKKHVQLRLNIMEYVKTDGVCVFDDFNVIREIKCKNLVVLTAPVVYASEPVPMRGFRGFRYSQKLF